jgi:hypothetical protein
MSRRLDDAVLTQCLVAVGALDFEARLDGCQRVALAVHAALRLRAPQERVLKVLLRGVNGGRDLPPLGEGARSLEHWSAGHDRALLWAVRSWPGNPRRWHLVMRCAYPYTGMSCASIRRRVAELAEGAAR